MFNVDSTVRDSDGDSFLTYAKAVEYANQLADEWENREHLRINAVVPGAIHSPLRGRTHPGEDKSVLPSPESLVPLYLHLVAGQTKAASGQLADAQAWLTGAPCLAPLRE